MSLEMHPSQDGREIRFDNERMIGIGRGLDIYQRPNDWPEVGISDFDLRPCLETKVDIFKGGDPTEKNSG